MTLIPVITTFKVMVMVIHKLLLLSIRESYNKFRNGKIVVVAVAQAAVEHVKVLGRIHIKWMDMKNVLSAMECVNVNFVVVAVAIIMKF